MVLTSTVLLVFLLPLAAPVPFRPTISASYIAGFNNLIAALATAMIGLAVLLWSSWQHARTKESPPVLMEDGKQLGPVLPAMLILASCTFYAVAESLLRHSGLRYLADAGYFIEQMSSHAESGRALYTGLEFAYGPLLFYPTVLLHHLLRCAWLRAYFVTLALEQSIGLLLVVYLLNSWPMRTWHRRFGLLLLAVGAINPLLGLNYTLFRFLTAFAVLTFATHRKGLLSATVVLGLGEVVLLGISAEQGIAFMLATLAVAALRAHSRGLRSLVLLAGPLTGAIAFAAIAGRPYFHMLASFSGGTLNLPVGPYPHILIFLFGVVWLIPYTLGPHVLCTHPSRQSMIACYGMGLGLLPATLGRCDPLHVFFDGAGLLLLSLACMPQRSRALGGPWIAALVLLVAWQQWVNNRLYQYRTADTLRASLMPHLPQPLQNALINSATSLNPGLTWHLRPIPGEHEYQLDTRMLDAVVGASQVATPLEVTPAVEAALKRSGHFRYSYFCFGVDAFDERTVTERNRSVNSADWMLLPIGFPPPFVETPADIGYLQGFVLPYRVRHAVPFDPGKLFTQNLQANWASVMNIGPYTLYRNNAAPR